MVFVEVGMHFVSRTTILGSQPLPDLVLIALPVRIASVYELNEWMIDLPASSPQTFAETVDAVMLLSRPSETLARKTETAKVPSLACPSTVALSEDAVDQDRLALQTTRRRMDIQKLVCLVRPTT